MDNINFIFQFMIVTLAIWRIRSVSTNDLLLPKNLELSGKNLRVFPSSYVPEESQILRISTTHFSPYMQKDANGTFTQGLEFQLVRMIAKILHMNLSFQEMPQRAGVCNNVHLNLSDICIGGIFPKEIALEQTTMSFAYLSDDLTWCVPAAKLRPRYISYFLALTPGLWIFLIFAYGYVSGFLLYLLIQFDLKYKRRNRSDWHYNTLLVVLPAVLGLSPNFYPTKTTTRIFFAFVLATAFFTFQIIFTRAYDTIYLQVEWHQVSFFEEIVDEGLRISGSQEAFNVLRKSGQISNEKMELFHICEDISECLQELLQDDFLAVAGSRHNILNSPIYSSAKMYCFDKSKSIATYPIALYMRKDFYLKDKVNVIIGRLMEAGYFEEWNVNRILLNPPRRKKYGPPDVPKPLDLNIIFTAVIITIGYGSILATGSFLIENFVFWKRKQRVKLKIWKYVENLFDGQRHYFDHIPEKLLMQNQHFVEARNILLLRELRKKRTGRSFSII